MILRNRHCREIFYFKKLINSMIHIHIGYLSLTMEELYRSKLKNYNHVGNVLWLSRHPKTTMTIVLTNSHIPWNMTALSVNQSITAEDIISNPQLEWDWEMVSHNRNFDKSIVNAYSGKDFYFHRIAMLEHASSEMICNNDECKSYAGVETAEDLYYENFAKNGLYGF